MESHHAHTHIQVLADRPTNTHLASLNNNNNNTTTGKSLSSEALKTMNMNNSGGDADVSSMDHHRRILQGKLANGEKAQGAYVSPSDDIMSPCTKKLSDLKGKRFKNAGKPQSLFAKLGKKNFEQSAAGSGAGAGGA